MSPEKTKILQERYPKIFGLKENSNEPYRLYGLECDDGWFDLIDTLCKNIQHHIDWKIKDLSEDEKEGFQVVATQIKEKFGSLRYYHNGGDDYIEGMISMAESMSSKICETCGEKATVQTKGWIKNICHACHIKRNFKEKGFELK
jgi:hypothetical protein